MNDLPMKSIIDDDDCDHINLKNDIEINMNRSCDDVTFILVKRITSRSNDFDHRHLRCIFRVIIRVKFIVDDHQSRTLTSDAVKQRIGIWHVY
jgi:hypothetical protein